MNKSVLKFLTASVAAMVLLLGFAKNSSAQSHCNLPGFHDISLSGGYGSIMQNLESYKKPISGYKNVEASGYKYTPTVSGEWSYRFSKKAAVGAILSFQAVDYKVALPTATGTANLKAKDYWYSLMPQFRYYWHSAPRFNIYSKAAAGFSAHRSIYSTPSENNKTREEKFKGFNFTWHISALGFEYGETFCVFAEGGYGTQGYALAGIRVKFAL